MEWRSHLKELSRHLVANSVGGELEQTRNQSIDYLGFPPAKIEGIEQAQIRLGFELPRSLKSFYLVSDGWSAADGFPVGVANILPVAEISLLSSCQIRDLEIYANFVEQHVPDTPDSNHNQILENCILIIDLDGNELGFAVRTESLDDWPIVTYNPDGCEFEMYIGFFELMKIGLTF